MVGCMTLAWGDMELTSVFWKVGLDQAEEQGSLRGAMPLGRLKEDEVREKRSYSKSVLGL